jgi:hypothetical protein
MSERTERSLFGRVVVFGLFWAALVYVCVAIFGSILVSLYGRPPVHGRSDVVWRAKQRTWCLTHLGGLRDDLEAQVTRELSLPPASPPAGRWEAWRGAWELELQEATASCTRGDDPAMSDAYEQLRALYQSYCRGVAEIVYSRNELLQALDRSLGQLRPRT